MHRPKTARPVANAACLAFLAVAALVACASLPPFHNPLGFKCGVMDVPCGNGCMPAGANTTCCSTVQGSAATTSSYCVSGPCSENTRQCEQAGAPSQFCCGTLGAIGSNDCPAGTHHCGVALQGGTGCVPDAQPGCCAEGSGQMCNEQVTAWNASPGECAGNGNPNVIVCGYCEATGACESCPPGSCCNGDVCGPGSCKLGDACFTNGGGAGGDAGPGGVGPCAGKCTNGYCGACSTTSNCCTGAVCISTKVCSVNSVASGCECSALGTSGVSGVCGDFADNGAPQITSCGGAGSSSCNTMTSWCCPGLVAVQKGAACTCEDPTLSSYECPGQ